MSVPNEEDFVRATVEAHPALLTRLQASSTATDALRKAKGNDDPSVLAGEVTTNDIKGKLCRVIVYALAQRDARWGLRRKDPSSQHATRSDGVHHATDVAFWKPDGKVVDILTDYGPTWRNDADDFQPADQWIAPLPEPDADTPPVENGDDPPTGRTLEDLWTFVVKLEQFHNNRLDTIDTRSSLLADRVKVLEQRPGGGFSGKLVITGVTLDVEPGP
jgi:hypothetical protein